MHHLCFYTPHTQQGGNWKFIYKGLDKQYMAASVLSINKMQQSKESLESFATLAIAHWFKNCICLVIIIIYTILFTIVSCIFSLSLLFFSVPEYKQFEDDTSSWLITLLQNFQQKSTFIISFHYFLLFYLPVNTREDASSPTPSATVLCKA